MRLASRRRPLPRRPYRSPRHWERHEGGGGGRGPRPPARCLARGARDAPSGRRRGGGGEGGGGAERAEREVIRALLFARNQVTLIADGISPDRFRDPRYRAIADALGAWASAAPIEALVASLPPEVAEVAAALVAEGPTGGDPVRIISDSLAALRVRELEERQAEIDRLMVVASLAEKKELMIEKVRH